MSLNKTQAKAVSHKDGPCLVLAGPGSGKTLTIVNRIKYLIEKCNVRPEEILVVTFTRFAAQEMKNRLCFLMGKKNLPVTAGTFHGIFYGILRCTYRMSGQNILAEEEKYQLLREVVGRQSAEVFDEEDFISDIAAEIGKIKNNRLDVEEYIPEKCSAKTFREIYSQYEEERKQRRKIDFDDMLVLCYNLLSSRPEVLEGWQRKFRYILIDEFQDINRIQYDVIRLLALPQNNLFVVGDDDQAIYGFRGADSELMFQFQKDYPQAEQILLGMNYRSTEYIVRNSLKVIRHNERRFEKQLEACRKGGACLHVQELADPTEEAEYILNEIEKSISDGVRPEDIAVLFRVHTDAGPVAETLVERRIPFQMKEHLPNIYSHFIGKDIQAYFRLAMGERKRQDYLQVMNRPKRYIGRDSLAGGAVSFEDIRKHYCDKEWMMDRIDQFEWDVKMMGKMAPYAAIQYMRKRIGYDDFLRDYAFSHNIPRTDLTEVIQEIAEAARPYRTMEEWFCHVEEYTRILQEKQKKEKKETPEGVRLMTIHAAKGLEFHTVFILDANEGRIPYKKARTDAQTEEERRLFYVAMTRAKEKLTVCYVKTKSGKETVPSRFVDELLDVV